MERTLVDSRYDSLENISPSKYRSVVSMVLNSLTASFLFGWCPANPALTNLGSTVVCPTATLNGSILTAAPLIGATLGSFAGGVLVAHGRIFAMLVMHFLFIVGNVISGLAEGVLTLTAARIIVGLGVGLSTYCVPLYISEVTPKARRGFFGVFHQLLITVGIVVANIVGLPLGTAPANWQAAGTVPITPFQRWWWRFSLGIPAALSAISMLLMFFVFNYETPHYMIMRSQYNEAAALLKRINDKTDVREEYNLIVDGIKQAQELQSTSISLFKAYQSSQYRRVINIAFFLLIFQQITGINLLITNSNRVFEAVNIVGSSLTGLSVGLTGVNVVMTLPAIFLIDRFGRKSLLIAGVSGQTVAMVLGLVAVLINPTSFIVRVLLVVSTFIFIVSFAVAYGPVPWVFLHEIFPVTIKQSVSAAVSASNWLGAILVVLPSDFYLQDGPLLMFAMFSVTNVIALIAIVFLIKETKGRSIDDSPYFTAPQKSTV